MGIHSPNFQDLTGATYGRLTVISYAGKTKRNRTLWNCICECGNKVVAQSDRLKVGDKKSCGCVNHDIRSKTCAKRNTTHGKRNTRLYVVWWDMRRRCNDAKVPEYKNYGARGIKVCAEWESSFETFYRWAMANGYDETAKRGACTIDRIDVNGDYCPENCRFVDLMVQAGNKRNNRFITHNGKTMTQSEWGRYYGKNRSFFCGTDELIERRMNGCDEYMRIYGKVPENVHCAKLSAEFARRNL